MQHVRYPNIFALGDAGSTPNSKTGAAIRKQAHRRRREPGLVLQRASADHFVRRLRIVPIVTSSQAMLLAEFGYSMTMKPTFPGLDPAVPHRSYWYLKKYGLPFLYWNLMLKGLA